MVHDSIPNGRNNTLVAESDLHAAYTAMEGWLDQRLSGVDDDSSTMMQQQRQQQQQQQRLFQDVVNSLKGNLDRIVQPISDEAFHALLFASKNGDFPTTEHEKVGTNSDKKQNNNEEEERKDVDFDEEELLDMDAFQRVKELREAARRQAARVVSIRTKVLREAVSRVEQNLEQWRCTTTRNLSEEELPMTTSYSDVVSVQLEGKVDEMQTALNQLRETLAVQSREIPRQLARFQDTVSTVAENLQRVPNQTDLAIQEREVPLIDLDAILPPVDPTDSCLAAELVARYLQQ